MDCSFSQDGCTCDINGKLNCTRNGRNDDKSVVFKKLEKVGEPFSCSYYGDNGLIMMQEYKVQDIQFVYTGKVPIYVTDEKHKRVAIAIKQNKEDMEEKKLNLKPFDIQKAKEGKPVCTRDGRRARIICFDRKFYHDGYNYPIVAMVNDNDNELVHAYTQDGLLVGNKEGELDLMMLPEKRNGWVNVYKERCYESKKEAIRHIAPGTHYIGTIKVEWEE